MINLFCVHFAVRGYIHSPLEKIAVSHLGRSGDGRFPSGAVTSQ